MVTVNFTSSSKLRAAHIALFLMDEQLLLIQVWIVMMVSPEPGVWCRTMGALVSLRSADVVCLMRLCLRHGWVGHYPFVTMDTVIASVAHLLIEFKIEENILILVGL